MAFSLLRTNYPAFGIIALRLGYKPKQFSRNNAAGVTPSAAVRKNQAVKLRKKFFPSNRFRRKS